MIDDFEQRVAALVSECDPGEDPGLAGLRRQYTDEEWSVLLEDAQRNIRLRARVAVFAKAVGEEAQRLGLTADGHALARFIAEDGLDAFDTESHEGFIKRLLAITDRHSLEETDAYDQAANALAHEVVEKALGSLDRELSEILSDS